MNAKDFLLVLVTVPKLETADQIATMLVYKDLAACVNIIPGLTSVFKWEGMIKKEQETLIMIKITKDQYGALEQEILKSHPYEVHEIIAFELAAGYDAYLNWIATGSTQHEE